MGNASELGIAESERVVDTQEAATVVGVKPATLETWRSRGGGPRFVKAGGRVVYRVAALRDWLRVRERASTSDAGHAG